MIKVQETKLIDILPTSLKKSKVIGAITKVLQKYIDENYEYIERLNILSNIDNITNEDLIDHLAYQFHVDFYDQKLSMEKKKTLVKNSIATHRKKGTVLAVEDVLRTIFGKSEIEEWFKYNGEPFFFRVNIDVTEDGISEDSLLRAEKLINAYKNTRSWLETIDIYLTNKGEMYIASAFISGENIVVYPYSPRNIESKGSVYIATGSNAGLENVTIYPRKEVI